MKRIFTVGMLVMALLIGTFNPSNAVMLRDKIPAPLPIEDDFHCRCKNVLCNCLEDCIYESVLISIAELFVRLVSGAADVRRGVCEAQCYDTWDGEPKYECYPLEPTPYDRMIDCTSRCIQKGGTRVDCIVDCGGY